MIPPPQNDTLYVKVSPTTDVPTYVGYGTTATLNGLVVNNGFGDAPVNQGYGTSQRYVSRGVHLVQIKTNGQTELKTPFITMEGAVTLTGTTGYNTGSAGAGAYHTYSASKDNKNRSVWIENPTIEESFWKDSLRRTAHMRNRDGSINTDSAVGYDVINQRWRIGTDFEAKSPNFIAPQYSWDWSGSGHQDGIPVNFYTGSTFALGIHFGDSLDPFPNGRTTVVSVNVTDSDGATAANTFSINWHLPHENFVALPIRSDAYRVIFSPTECTSPPAGPGTGQIATFNFSRRQEIGDLVEGAATGLALASTIPGVGEGAVLLAGLGMALDAVAEEWEEGPLVIMNDVDTWNESAYLTANWGQSLVPIGLTHGECMMDKPRIAIHYDDHPYTFDAYDEHGYVGEKQKVKRIPSPGRHWYPAGSYITSNPPAAPQP